MPRHKRTIAALALGALAVTLTGCGGDDQPQAATAPTATVAATRTQSPDEKMLDYLGYGGIPENQQHLFLPAAHGMCDALRSSTKRLTTDDLASLMRTLGKFREPGQAEWFAGISIDAYCPEYADRKVG